jgi:hypothetical protein
MTSQQKVNQVSTSVEIVIPTPVGNTTALAEIIPTMVGNTPVSTGNNTAATLCQLTPDAVSDLSCDNSSAEAIKLAKKENKKAKKKAKAAQKISPPVSPITVVIKEEQKPASQEPTVQAAPAPAPAPEPKKLNRFALNEEKKKAPTEKPYSTLPVNTSTKHSAKTKSAWAPKTVSKVAEMKLLMEKKTELEAKLENANCAFEAVEAEEEDEESDNFFDARKLVLQLRIELATLTNTLVDLERLKVIKTMKQKKQIDEMEQTLASLNGTVAEKQKRLASKDLSQLFGENKTSAPAPATPAAKPSAKPAPPTKKANVKPEEYKIVGKDGKIIPNSDEKKTPLVARAEAFVDGLRKNAIKHGKFFYNPCKGNKKTGNDWSNLATASFPFLLENPLKVDEKDKDELFQQVRAVAQAMANSDVYVGMWPHSAWFTLLLDRGCQEKLVWQFASRFSLPTTGPQWKVLITKGHNAPNGAGRYQVLATDNSRNTLINKYFKGNENWKSEHIVSLREHVKNGTFRFVKLENGEPMTVEEFDSWYDTEIALASAAE